MAVFGEEICMAVLDDGGLGWRIHMADLYGGFS